MKNSLIKLIILALALAATGPASTLVAGDAKVFHCLQKTLIPGTVYYFPDGRASADSAWNDIGTYKNAASYYTLFAVMDSTLGYDSPCSLRVEAYYGIEGVDGFLTSGLFPGDTMRVDTMHFLGYPTKSVVFNQPFLTVPEDSARLISCGVYLHDKLRWRVTATDSCTLSLIEKQGKP